MLDLLCASTALLCASIAVSAADLPDKSQAPVPASIGAGKKAFVSNAGMDGTSFSAFQRLGEADQPYNAFYAAMKSWGRFDLAGAPGDADLIFEVSFASPMTDCGKATFYGLQMQLRIIDARTHFILWSLTQPMGGGLGGRKETFDKNFDKALADLMTRVKDLVARSATSGG